MNKLRQIAREFDEPFVDVVRGFAEMGYSRRATAQILNFNLPYFRSLCTRFGLHRYFKSQRDMRQECKGHGKGWPEGRPQHRSRRYTDAEILAEVNRFPVSTLFQAMAPMDIATVQRRFGSWTNARWEAWLDLYYKEMGMNRFVTLPAGPFAGQPCRVLERDIIESVLWLEMPNGEVERVCGRTVGDDLGL